MSKLLEYARRELELWGAFDNDNLYGNMVGKAVMELIEVFAGQGHSGTSAAIALRLFSRVADWKPLTPIADDPDQWRDIGAEYGTPGIMQHKRCGTVFKAPNQRPYNGEAVVFRTADGVTFTSQDSAREITFPYAVPDSPEIIDEPGPSAEGRE